MAVVFRLPGLLRALRPGQWTKNLFVLAPLVFGKALTDTGSVKRTLLAAIGFSLAASALYLLNDILDREADRQHPTKRNRPIASGEVSARFALVLSAILLTASLATIWFVVPRAAVVVIAYALVTALYSAVLKRVALLDVMVIATGFVLRVLAGSFAADVRPSHWLLLCTFFLALFLALSKRRGELVSTGTTARRSLQSVPLSVLESFENVALGVTIVCYALYTVAPETTRWIGDDRLLATVPIVVFGLFRWRLLETRGGGEDATTDLFTDPGLLATVLVWAAICIGLVYRSGGT